jgi:hypothetical protein
MGGDGMTWRELGDKQRGDFMVWVEENMGRRLESGRERYGDIFDGSPLKHAAEEMFDALLYIYYAMREQEARE